MKLNRGKPDWHGPAERPSFIPKRRATSAETYDAFGASRADCERWLPESCGPIGLKMVGDAYGLTTELSPFHLLLRCRELGGFVEKRDGSIRGVFHGPLVALAKELGLEGQVDGALSIDRINALLRKGRFVLLSIDLSSLGSGLRGGHLVVVDGVDEQGLRFRLQDSASLLGDPGRDVIISRDRLRGLSNTKGIVLWHESRVPESELEVHPDRSNSLAPEPDPDDILR